MSDERRKRQQKRVEEEAPKPGRWKKKIITAVLVMAAFGAAYYLGFRKRTSRLDSFAQCVGKETKMYGLYWCTHCAEQKELFGSSFQYVPYIECGIPGQARGETESCRAAGVKQFPTWEFASKERHEGVLPLTALAEKTGCSLP